jgi:hypothetical protein
MAVPGPRTDSRSPDTAPRELGVSNVKVADVWREYGLQPWRTEMFSFRRPADPQLEAKVRDVFGLYLSPPENAIVLCADEKSQVQALDRTAPILQLRPGSPAKQTHDYVRHGHHQAVGGPRSRHRQGHRRVLPAAPAAGVLEVPEKGRRRPSAARHIVVDNYPPASTRTCRRGSLGTRGSRSTSTDLGVPAEHGRGLRHHDPRGHRPRNFRGVKDLITAIETVINDWHDRLPMRALRNSVRYFWQSTADGA